MEEVSKKVQNLIKEFSSVTKNDVLVGLKTKRIYLPLEEFAKLTPFRGQFYDKTPIVSESHVNDLLKIREDVIEHMALNPPILNSKGEIIKGNHRNAMINKALAKGLLLERTRKIPVDVIVEETNLTEDTKNAMLDNFGPNDSNGLGQMLFGKSKASEQLFIPMMKAFAIAGATDEIYAQKELYNIVARVASFLNKNPSAAEQFFRTGKLNVTALGFYNLKGSKTLNTKNFLTITEDDVVVDLRKHVDVIARGILQSVRLTEYLRGSESEIFDKKKKRYLSNWEAIFGGCTMSHYYLMSLAFNGKIVSNNGKTNRKDVNLIDYKQFAEIGSVSPDAQIWISNLNNKTLRDEILISLNNLFFPKRTVSVGTN